MKLDERQTRSYLSRLMGHKGRGYVALAHKKGTDWTERQFSWPDQAEDVINWAKENINGEVFVCPALRSTPSRRKGGGVGLRWLWADVDMQQVQNRGLIEERIKKLGTYVVASGTGQNRHVYVKLTRTVSPEEHYRLNTGLRDYLSADNKQSDETLLRLPGTINHKPCVGRVVRRVGGTGATIDPDALTALSGWVEAPVHTTGTSGDGSWTRVDIASLLKGRVRSLCRMSGDEATTRYGSRFKALYAIVGDLTKRGFDRDTIHSLLDEFPPALDKQAEEHGAYDVHRDIDKVLERRPTDVVKYSPDDNFWDRRPKLRHIHDYAIASFANPWAALGVVMVRLFHLVPPNVKLPGINNSESGTRALNLFVTLVGDSGAGKKTATDAGTHAVDMGYVTQTLPLGSGEGMAKAYRRRGTKGEPDTVTKATAVIFDVAEVSTWNALAGRTGQTLTGEVLKAFSGEGLGFSNSDDSKNVPVPANSYRMGLILGAQPGTCGPLLGNVVSGLPQRFLWMPAEVEVDYDPDNLPPVPVPMMWDSPRFDPADHTLVFCPTAQREMILNRIPKRGEKRDPLESQSPVIKLRVAAALALLEGRTEVNDEDWELAGVVMAVSRRTRAGVIDQLRDAARRENHARAQLEGERRIVAENVVEADKVERAKVRVLKVLDKGDWVTGLPKKAGPAYRDHLGKAVMELLKEGLIERRSVEYRGQSGWSYRRVKG